jgi:hypothetical protein
MGFRLGFNINRSHSSLFLDRNEKEIKMGANIIKYAFEN